VFKGRRVLEHTQADIGKLFGKTCGNRRTERPVHRREKNVKFNFREMGCGDVKWI
jgi:hypothetical protein